MVPLSDYPSFCIGYNRADHGVGRYKSGSHPRQLQSPAHHPHVCLTIHILDFKNLLRIRTSSEYHSGRPDAANLTRNFHYHTNYNAVPAMLSHI
jgi:hypothetical protein